MQHNSEKSEPKGRTRMQWAVALLVNTTVFTYGLQWGWVSPMTKILQSTKSPAGRPLTDAEISLIAGLPSIAAIIGIPLLRYISDTWGRKISVILMAICQLIGWIIKILPTNIVSLLIARLFLGFGAAGCFHIVPMYVKEISQDNIRGALGSILIMFQNLGVLIMYGMGGYLGYYTVLYIVTGISVLFTVILFIAPDSPSYLVNRGKLKEAAAALAFLRSLNVNATEVQTELDSIKKEDDYFKSIPSISFFSIFKNKAWRSGFIVMALIAMLRGVNGSFAIISYAATLLENSGLNISPDLQSLAIPVFLTLGTVITMSTVDRLGRKMLLGVTFFITSITFGALAIDVLLRDRGYATFTWLPIAAILIIMFCYGAGIAPLLFIIMPEMFNYEIRGKLTGSLCMWAWSMNFVQLFTFTSISNAFGVDMSFFTFSALNLIGVVVVLVLLPETNGKNVEEIERKLRKVTNFPKLC